MLNENNGNDFMCLSRYPIIPVYSVFEIPDLIRIWGVEIIRRQFWKNGKTDSIILPD